MTDPGLMSGSVGVQVSKIIVGCRNPVAGLSIQRQVERLVTRRQAFFAETARRTYASTLVPNAMTCNEALVRIFQLTLNVIWFGVNTALHCASIKMY